MQYESLKNTIVTLSKLRDVYHSQLDAGDLAEIDDVLRQLTRLSKLKRRDIPLGELAVRALLIIDATLKVVTNLTDLMK